jgi:hypothetical protein
MEIQRIIREYFENLYSNKLENLKEEGTFLDMYDLPKLNQEDISNLSRHITSNGIEAITEPSTKKSPGSDRFTAEFDQTFEELTPMLLKLVHKI